MRGARRAGRRGRTPHSGPERTGPVRPSVPQGARLSRRPPGAAAGFVQAPAKSEEDGRSRLHGGLCRFTSLGRVAWRPGPWSNAPPREGAPGSWGSLSRGAGGEPLLTDQSLSSARAAWRRGRPAAEAALRPAHIAAFRGFLPAREGQPVFSAVGLSGPAAVLRGAHRTAWGSRAPAEPGTESDTKRPSRAARAAGPGSTGRPELAASSRFCRFRTVRLPDGDASPGPQKGLAGPAAASGSSLPPPCWASGLCA